MNTEDKANKYLNKINKILKNNKDNMKLNNVDLLIMKVILQNLNLLEKDEYIKKLVIKRIKFLLKGETCSYNSIYTRNEDLTKQSTEIILNIYREYGFRAVINQEVIKKHYIMNNLNYNLFFNQVETNKDVMIDYFKCIEDEQNSEIMFQSNYLESNGLVNLSFN